VQGAGSYAISVAASPPAPTVTLTASATSVVTGGTVTLNWSSQNATGCTASGGWSGSRPASGSETTATINAATTYTLTCSGGGGSASASATVNVSAPPAGGGSGGGGGFLDAWLLSALFALAVAATLRRVRRCQVPDTM